MFHKSMEILKKKLNSSIFRNLYEREKNSLSDTIYPNAFSYVIDYFCM